MTEIVGPQANSSTENSSKQRTVTTIGESLYHVLDLEKGATPEEVKKKYRFVFK